jgi:hypothetical protein
MTDIIPEFVIITGNKKHVFKSSKASKRGSLSKNSPLPELKLRGKFVQESNRQRGTAINSRLNSSGLEEASERTSLKLASHENKARWKRMPHRAEKLLTDPEIL